MKGIRMAVLGAALVFGITATASAQGGGAGGGGGRGRGGITRLMTDITVSAETQTKIDTIVAKYMTQQRELMGMPAGGAAAAGGGGGGGGMANIPEETRAKITELNNKRNAEIRALLTAEQAVVFDKNVAAAAAGGGRRGGGAAAGAGAPPPFAL